MSLHSIIGLHGVSLAAPPSHRQTPAATPAPAAPVTLPAPMAPAAPRHKAAPERMLPQTRATLAALAQSPAPVEAPDLRRVLGDGVTANVLTGQLHRLSVWGFAHGAPGQSGRYEWQVTAAGREFLASCTPVADSTILQAVAEIARQPVGTYRWWITGEPGRGDTPTTPHSLTRHLQAQGHRIHSSEAAARLADLANRGLLHRGKGWRKGAWKPCYWPKPRREARP